MIDERDDPHVGECDEIIARSTSREASSYELAELDKAVERIRS